MLGLQFNQINFSIGLGDFEMSFILYMLSVYHCHSQSHTCYN